MNKTQFGGLVACAVAGFIAGGATIARGDAPLGKCFATNASCAGNITVKHNGQELKNTCAGIPVDGVTQDECTAAGGTWQAD
jgi:hypothetical protein